MKWVGLAVGLLLISAAVLSPKATALTVEPTPPKLSPSPIIITAYEVDGANLDFVQLYNSGKEPVRLGGWRVSESYVDAAGTALSISVELDGGWLLPDQHIVISANDLPLSDDTSFNFPSFNLPLDDVAQSLTLLSPKHSYQPAMQPIDDTSGDFMARRLTSAGNYSSSDKFDVSTEPTIYDDGFYRPPNQAPPVKIIEILANAADCAPDDKSLACGDYVKLYNPTNQPIDLSGYNLRTDSGGKTSSSSNTFWLNDKLAPKDYLTVHLKDGGEAINLTNSGGYVWLEDVWGLKRYDKTIVKYADASSSTKQGWSWAFDKSSGDWRWTSTPRPDRANKFTLPKQIVGVSTANKPHYTPCDADQFRNPLTHRCKLKVSVTNQLKPCAANQFRNPATNRCKSRLAAAANYAPCGIGKKRNPATHRCRSVLGAKTSYVPCDPGEKRSPKTHRCRQVSDSAWQVGAVTPDQLKSDLNTANYGNLILAGTGVAVVGYGLFEWRKELFEAGRRVFSVLGRK